MSSTGRREAVSADDFFIPDLCAPQAVLLSVILAELLVVVYLLAAGSLVNFDWLRLGLNSLFVQWVVLLSAALLCLLRGQLSRLHPALAAGWSLTLVALVTVFSSILIRELYPPFTGRQMDAGWLLRNVLVALILAAVTLRYFYMQYELARQQRAELQARLSSLRAKIRPHFLFNTLNSIASLIAVRPTEAERAVEDVAELFRASLQDVNRNATVDDELRLCELYLGIEALRLGDRLRVSWTTDPALRGQPMPSLLLQPLLENAVYHGVARLADGGRIDVTLKRDGGFLRVRIVNPLPAEGDAHARAGSGEHMGLDNIRQRLEGMFPGRSSLDARREGDSFVVDLALPLEARS